MNIIRWYVTLIVLAIGIGIVAERESQAELVTYTESVTGSGSFGGTAFTDQLVTLSLTADSSQVTNPSSGIFLTADSLLTITVSGSGSGTLQAHVFVNQTSSLAGFNPNPDLLGVINASFAGYDLQGPIGPLVGVAYYPGSTLFQTTNGDFILDSVSSDATFQAVLAPVPEPSSLAMCGIAVVTGLLTAGLRRRRAAR